MEIIKTHFKGTVDEFSSHPLSVAQLIFISKRGTYNVLIRCPIEAAKLYLKVVILMTLIHFPPENAKIFTFKAWYTFMHNILLDFQRQQPVWKTHWLIDEKP